ncbi:MAG TPA: phosphoribosylformylglycinamidine synthase subunit PurL [Deinococcales bacterium]|nr:phosphoribosylformylglycinamidine synthase subunit PurL [Deinococcales bacterium]
MPPAASGSLRDKAATFGLTTEEFDQVVAAMGREPNTLEAAMFGALWSEHCGYKNSRPLLRRLPTQGPQVLQGPGENAGVVDIGDGWAVSFKMESHNHPSAVEPVQGAATGVGGILRDIFAMGARPIAVLDSLRFGSLDSDRTRFLLHGVVTGIAGYGNAIGVPTVGGEVTFHPSYQENPLVNAMAVGLMRHGDLRKGTVGAVGNTILYVGSKTGRDGLGGAVFASADLSGKSSEDRPAVQVGDPFMEKLLLEATLDAIKHDLVAGVQDMGAAGLTSSVGEMAHRAGLGVDLDVALVPRRESGMTPLEVMLSESQERMVLIAKPGREAELMRLLEKWELDVCAVGTVADHGMFRILENGTVVGDMPVKALNEAPTYTREGREDPRITARREASTDVPLPDDLRAVWLRLLAHPSIASKRPIFERYDHQVMTNTVVLPGRADAAVLRVKGTSKGIAASTDCNPRFCYLDPYLGAAAAVAESARNVTCVGARPLAITDCLNFGNPTRPEVYYQLERAMDGLRDACLALGTPVTGGNVSLYNQYVEGGETLAIHPTPTVGMVGVLDDITRRADQALKRDGDSIILIGRNTGEIGASQYLESEHGIEGGRVPALDLALEKAVQVAARVLIERGLCDTAHDCSEGGLAVAIAEMAISGGRGATVRLADDLRADAVLFGEAHSRILVAVPAESLDEALASLQQSGVPFAVLGAVGGDALTIELPGQAVSVPVVELTAAFEEPLRRVLR